MSNRTGSAGKSKWIGYIDNYFFLNNNDTGGGTSPGNKDFLKKGWFIEDQFIAPPTEVFIGNWNIARPAISAFADYNGTVAGTTKATTASSHSLLTGDTVTITSSPDSYYNDTYTITKIDADEFYFTKAYSAEDSGILSTGQHSSISEFESFADCTDSYHWDEITTANLISISYAESDNDTNMSVALQSRWLLGISYIYDGIDGGESPEGMKGVNYPYAQESSITVLVDDKSSNVYKILDFTGYTEAPIIQAHFKAGSSRNDAVNTQLIGMNSRITGMRFYIKEFEGEGDISALKKESTKPWLRIAEADLCQGVWTCFTAPISNDSSNDEQEAITSRITSVNDTRGNNWNGSANGGAEFMTITTTGTDADIGAAISTAGGMLNGIPLFDLPIESYYSLNGYKENHLISCKYTTATVLNHSAYIGDIYDITNDKYYGDRVIRTPKFKLDTFSTDFFVDIVPGDGDNIVKLENYADRLMVFKHNKLFIINVSQESMFIEQELNGMGVAFPGQVVKTDIGITWCNKNGVHIFNGTKVQNLTDNKIKTTWDAFYTEEIDTASEFIDHDYTQVGFDPKSKHIIFLKSNNAYHGDCLIYDMKVAGWIYLDSFFTDGEDKTNFFTSVDNKLIIHQNDANDYILRARDRSGSTKVTIGGDGNVLID